MDSKTVTAEEFGAAVIEIMEKAGENVRGILQDASRSAAESTCEAVRANSMQFESRRHAYANSWAVSEAPGGYVVHNKRHYRLTHLLENGHAVSNQWGATGKRAGAYPHIKPAEIEGVDKFINEVNKKLETEL